ncbi:MAG TPA: phosphomannomutase/phosphoglucomutase [Actinomycetota bacterium]|nr:phosphomannomutase/phosphoglucomutase [Actinomycetota bacterium]
MDLASIFKAYDIRGTYPDQIDEVAVYGIGAAFAVFADAQTVVVGRDMRLSSPAIARAFIEGVNSQGVDVVDIGQVSTDALYFASGRYAIPGAMITASHNPGNYNGIKPCRASAAPIGQDTGLLEIKALAESGLSPAARVGTTAEREILPEFIDHLLSFIDADALRPLKVVVDAANGMAGKIVPMAFERLPVELVPLYFELDGTFPNHPADPIQIENLRDLRDKVISEKADLGLAFDGDADRVFLVDEKAEPVSGSLTTALVASRALMKEKGASVVHNLICSRVVSETVREFGGTPIRTRVGHSFIKQVMAETNSIFGGEHSGHYYFRDNFRADSGLICAMFVLEALSVQSKGMSEVLQPFQRYWNSGEINTPVPDQDAKLKELAGAFADGSSDWTDGLTVDYEDWWFNVRGSNTEPLLRLNVEARDPDYGAQMTAKLVDLISK